MHSDRSIPEAELAACLNEWDWQPGELGLLAEALSRPGNPSIRLQGDATPDDVPFETIPVPWHKRGRELTEGRFPAREIAYGAGRYYVQDKSSLLAIQLLKPQPGEWICDLCSAPGGKATAILDELRGSGFLLANEVVKSRIAPLLLNLSRQGSTNWLLSDADPQLLLRRWAGRFDAVLVDAPCSGQSLLGKGKQTAGAFDEKTVEHCALRQQRILDVATQLVRPGGRLVYSTCTFSPEENEHRIRALLDAEPDWSREGSEELQSWESQLLPQTYRLWPHRGEGTGGFAACIRAAEDAATGTAERTWRKKKTGKIPISLDNVLQEIASWGKLEKVPNRLFEKKLITVSDEAIEDFILAKEVCGGPEAAEMRGRTWVPSYGLAMRRDGSFTAHNRFHVNDDEATAYLQGQTFAATQRGWGVVTWNDQPLGWGKGDGRLVKNHLPKSARLQLPS